MFPHVRTWGIWLSSTLFFAAAACAAPSLSTENTTALLQRAVTATGAQQSTGSATATVTRSVRYSSLGSSRT